MALNGDALATAMVSALGINTSTTAGAAALLSFKQAMNVLVTYFQTNAQVTIAIAPGSVATGVTGGGASVPVTGTGTGTIA